MSASAADPISAGGLRHEETASPQVSRVSWALFSIVTPLLMAVPLGWYGAGVAGEMSRGVALLVWALTSCLSWWVSDLCTRALARVVGRRRPRSLPLLVAGFGVNVALARYYCPAMLDALVRIGLVQPTPIVVGYFTVDRDLLDPGYIWGLLGTAVPGLLFWLAGNVAYEWMNRDPQSSRAPSKGLDDPRPVGSDAGSQPGVPSSLVAFEPIPASSSSAFAGSASAGAAVPAPAIPRFFLRLSRLAGLRVDELVAVEAEDHYVQVHSTRGKELIYYRFRDALEELADVSGLQIHRSTWVSRRHIVELDGRGRNLQVVLDTGERLKVSLSNRGALLQAGLRMP